VGYFNLLDNPVSNGACDRPQLVNETYRICLTLCF